MKKLINMSEMKKLTIIMFELNKIVRLLVILISVFIVLLQSSTAYGQWRTEVVNGDTLSIYRYPSRANIKVDVNAEIQVGNSGLEYIYSIQNSKESALKFHDFKILTSNFSDSIASPNGWFIYSGGIIPGVSWTAEDSSHFIGPGETLENLKVISQKLPSISKYHSWGFVEIPSFAEEPDSIENSSVSEDSFKGYTIFPGTIPEGIDSHSDSLRTYLDFSCTNGWVTNRGICRSLEAKLENVDKQLGRDKIKQAVNGLRAFLNEVEAQKGKHITSEGYALFYYNAAWLKQQLEQSGN